MHKIIPANKYMHSVKTKKFLQRNLASSYMPYMELVTVVKNCCWDLKIFTTLTKSTRCETGIHIYCIFKAYFNN